MYIKMSGTEEVNILEISDDAAEAEALSVQHKDIAKRSEKFSICLAVFRVLTFVVVFNILFVTFMLHLTDSSPVLSIMMVIAMVCLFVYYRVFAEEMNARWEEKEHDDAARVWTLVSQWDGQRVNSLIKVCFPLD